MSDTLGRRNLKLCRLCNRVGAERSTYCAEHRNSRGLCFVPIKVGKKTLSIIKYEPHKRGK